MVAGTDDRCVPVVDLDRRCSRQAGYAQRAVAAGLRNCPDHCQPWGAVIIGGAGERRQWQASAQPLQWNSGEDDQPLQRGSVELDLETVAQHVLVRLCVGRRLANRPQQRRGLDQFVGGGEPEHVGQGGFPADGPDLERQRRGWLLPEFQRDCRGFRRGSYWLPAAMSRMTASMWALVIFSVPSLMASLAAS